MATRGPAGRGWPASRSPASTISVTVSTPDDTGLAHQRGDRGVGDAADRDGVAGRVGAAVPGALHHDDGLHGGGTAGETGELAWIAERFEVEQRDVGVGVLEGVLRKSLPETSARLPAEMNRGQARTAPVEAGEQGDADRAGLGEQADPAAGGRLGGEGGVQPDGLGGVDDAEGVRADDPHAVRAGLADEFALELAALGAPLGVSGGEDDQALDAVFATVGDGLGDAVGGDGDNGEVDLLVDLAERAVRAGTPSRVARPSSKARFTA